MLCGGGTHTLLTPFYQVSAPQKVYLHPSNILSADSLSEADLIRLLSPQVVLAHELGGGEAQEAAGLTGDAALQQNAVVLYVHTHNLHLTLLHGHVSHLPLTLGAGVHAARGGTRPSGT